MKPDKKILFISINSDPFRELSHGAFQRTHLLLSAFAKVACVDVCAFVDSVESDIEGCNVVFSGFREQQSRQYRSPLSRLFSLFGKCSPENVFRVNRPMAEVVANIAAEGEYDYIVVRYLQTIAQLGLTKYLDKVIVDLDDNPVRAYIIGERIKGGIHAILPEVRALAIKRVWKYVLKQCALSFCSDPSEARRNQSYILHNVPIISYQSESNGERSGLFFVGALNYPPNQDGITHFLKKVWPELHSRYPEMRFRIAGKCFDDALVSRWNECAGVDVLGYVDDISKEYGRCAVAVSPIYYGAGTNIKVLEAISMRTPCVTTPTGFNGLDAYFSDGENPLVAENDNDFVKCVSFLLDNPEKAHEMAGKSLRAVEKLFTAANFDAEVKSAFSSISSQKQDIDDRRER